MTTHTTIDRLHALCRDLGSETLTVGNVVEALSSNRRSVCQLLSGGALEHSKCTAHHRGKDALNRKVRHNYTIEAAAVLIYLVKNTGGDKTVLLEAIRIRFPHHHALCLRVAGGGDTSTREDTRKDACAPKNVIPMHGKRAVKPSLPKEHPGQMFLFNFSEAEKATA